MIAALLGAAMLATAATVAVGQTCDPYWVRPGIFPASPSSYTTGLVYDDGTGPGLFVIGRRENGSAVTFPNKYGLFRYRSGSWDAADDGLPARDMYLGQSLVDYGQGPMHLLSGQMSPPSRPILTNTDMTRWSRFRNAHSVWPAPQALTQGWVTQARAIWNDGAGSRLYRSRYNHVERFDGTSWQVLGQNLGANADVLTVADDGTGPTLFASGYFRLTPTGSYSTRVIKWTGFGWLRLASSFPWDGEIGCMASYDDGNGPRLYVAGSIRPLGIPGGPETYGIVKWDGEQWTDVGGGITTGLIRQINVLKVWDDGNGPKLYACGWVGGMGGQNTIGIAAWDGQHWSTVSTGLHGIVTSLSEMDDPRGRSLFAVGDINAVAGQSPRVLQLVGCPNCYVDCDADGSVTVEDFLCFVNAYARKDPLANCDGDQALTPADFACFQARYAQGCPGWTGWPPRPPGRPATPSSRP